MLTAWPCETEAATHGLRWIASRGGSQTTHTIIPTDSMSLLQKSEKWNGKPRLTWLCQCSTSTFEESCGCAVLG